MFGTCSRSSIKLCWLARLSGLHESCDWFTLTGQLTPLDEAQWAVCYAKMYQASHSLSLMLCSVVCPDQAKPQVSNTVGFHHHTALSNWYQEPTKGAEHCHHFRS